MALPADVNATDTFETWRLNHNQVKNNTLDKTLNLSDVPDAALARTNLGIDTAIEDSVIAMTIALS